MNNLKLSWVWLWKARNTTICKVYWEKYCSTLWIQHYTKCLGPRWQSGNTLASHLWGRGSIPRTASSGKAGSCLPLVGSLQYRTLTNCMYWFPLPFQLPVVIWPVQCWKRCKTLNKFKFVPNAYIYLFIWGLGRFMVRGNQYILVKVLYCKLPTTGRQLRSFWNKVRGLNRRPKRWEAIVLPLHHHAPY